MAERLKKRPEILDRRREVVEHPFGSIKQWMHQGAFLTRGLANVRTKFSLTALACNLRRALDIFGVEVLTAAVWPEARHAGRFDRRRTNPALSGRSERSVSPKSPEFPRPNPLASLRPKTRRVSARTASDVLARSRRGPRARERLI
jgi:Transposase DDE domain